MARYSSWRPVIRSSSTTALVLLALGCTPAAQPPQPEPRPKPTPRAVTLAEPTVPDAPATPAGAPVDAQGRPTVIEGTIVGESPIGDGKCTQKSYEVDAAPRVWVHFEHCGGGAEKPFIGFKVGERVRFTVVYGKSDNFGDEPMIVDAERL